MSGISYSVAIRTIGKAGEKYRKLLNAIKAQTVPPEKVIVVLPEGYELPPERLGYEQFVFSPKGMIKQRIEALKYIDSEYTLFCDDDVEPEPSFIEKVAEPLQSGKYSASAGPLLNFFPPNTPRYWFASLLGGACVMLYGRDHQYTRILSTGGWSYNHSVNTKAHTIYDADSLAWTCFFIKTDALRNIHFEDELWIEKNGYAYGDDQAMFYKLLLNGYKTCVVSDALYLHNDAKTSTASLKLETFYCSSFNRYVFWHRFQYSQTRNPIKKAWLKLCVEYSHVMGSIYAMLLQHKGRRSADQVNAGKKGLADAKEYIDSIEYKMLHKVKI